MRGLLLMIVLSFLLTSVIPVTPVHADASVVQDSCVVISVNPKVIRFYFTVVNFSLPTAVCDLHFTPEPLPAPPGCIMLACGNPVGWSCFLNPLGGADWFANTPADCIQPGTAKGNFWFDLDPAFCCYVVQFTDATGAVILEQEECFTTCNPVPTEENNWGEIKNKFKE